MVFSSYEIAWYWQRFRVRQCLGQTEFSTGSLSASPAGPEGSSWPARTCNPTSEALVLHQGLDPDRHLWRGILLLPTEWLSSSTNNFKCLSPSFSLSGGTSTQPRVSAASSVASLPRGHGHSRGCLKLRLQQTKSTRSIVPVEKLRTF